MATHPFQGENLARFRYHTGATLRPLAPDEPCRVLFRDVGPVAVAAFLRGRLRRLAGPLAPILYTRTADYREPYVDHGRIGRLVFLRPHALNPWFSGVPTIHVASLRQRIDPDTIGFVPGGLDLHEAEVRLAGAADFSQLREALGGREFDERVAANLAAVDRLNAEHAEAERGLEPLRRDFQSRDPAEAEAARDWLGRHALAETDLCTAWHHLPDERRAVLRDAARILGERLRC
jgi:hypothetical protein